MEIQITPIKDLLIIRPRVFRDERGEFFESYNQKVLQDAGVDFEFVQDNQSLSGQNVVRGLHFQNPPYAQGKLVRTAAGAVLDVAVDIRKKSPTYGRYFKIELTAENHTMLWIPPGFAHGFAALAEQTVFCYKCTNYYNNEAEGSLLWNDPDLNIDWQIAAPILSDKDQQAGLFRDFKSQF